MNKFVILLFAAIVSLGQANKCGIAPRFWCDSQENAIKCGVLEACSSRLNPTVDSGHPVAVSVYFESYCPDSIKFLTTMLYPTWQKLHMTGIMQLMIFPYGKAKYFEKSDGSYRFVCQHGARECLGNTIENCLIHHGDFDSSQYLPVVQCMETAIDPNSAAENCAKEGGYDWDIINKCAHGSEGNKFFHQAGVVTENRQPDLNWVPWIVINGVHDDQIQSAALSDLKSLICETYVGAKPTECSTSRFARSLFEGDYPVHTELIPSRSINSVHPVAVAVYFESYCPDSIKFLTTMLYPTWQELHSSGIMMLIIFPYGKAQHFKKPDGSYGFVCQHGAKECLGNTIENCLVHYAGFDPTKYFPVVQCMETAADPDSAAEQCSKDGGYDWTTINACAEGPEGNKFLYEAGVATEQLQPKLNWVPWIVVNGVHNDQIQAAAIKDLKSLVCDTYQGVKPTECKSSDRVKLRFTS